MIVDVDKASPILQDERSPIVREPKIVFCVPYLDVLRRPTAVCWLVFCLALVALSAGVAAERVDSINLMSRRWCCSHVFKEGVKGILPALAHVVTDASVPGIISALRAEASVEHFPPYRVFSCNGKSSSALLDTSVGTPDEAAAAYSCTFCKVVSGNVLFQSAFTAACPIDATPAVVRLAQDGQLAENLSRQVFQIEMGLGTLRISHDASPESRVVRADPAHQRLAGSFILLTTKQKRNTHGCWSCTVTTEPTT